MRGETLNSGSALNHTTSASFNGTSVVDQSRRRIRLSYINAWAAGLEPARTYIERVPGLDLQMHVANASDPHLLRKARLDCDWYCENARCFAALAQTGVDFLPALVCGPASLVNFVKLPRNESEERWLIVMAHQPQALGPVAGKVFALLRRAGVRILFYAFDEASRFMPCFREIAPHLDVLIHDEAPLDPAGEKALRPDCVRIHRSWVANVVPFAAPFNEAPEEKILFLGSQLGLTDHRKRQIAHLQKVFKDRFVAIHDHSVSVADRYSLNRYKVSVCPEGRKFTTPGMSRTHTDRPFWSGCLGMVPVSEDSKQGGRLEELGSKGLIVRYPHGDLKVLTEACERSLAMGNDERRRIYEHFNRHETIGTVVADAIAAAAPIR
jgi:hypothetical protein